MLKKRHFNSSLSLKDLVLILKALNSTCEQNFLERPMILGNFSDKNFTGMD